MEKIRRIIVGIISAIYLILIIKKVDIPRNTFIILMLIILVNQSIDEGDSYRKTKKKVHLVIPIILLILLILLIGIYLN